MSRYSSDAKQRHSRKYLAIIRELEGGNPAEHLTRLTPLPSFSVTTSSDIDRITRHRSRSMDWKRHGE